MIPNNKLFKFLTKFNILNYLADAKKQLLKFKNNYQYLFIVV